MSGKTWSLVGLAYGLAVGFAGAFGGFGAFLIVLLLGALGFLVGRVVDGELDMGEVFASFGGNRKS
ncbi:hypothetical protein [Actinomadura parmotrematis]|uniref:DUF2273 domain-containing protein n=1 Tax=Actinomadura parmotrematis TaxID=2864039 RepID=A0ABS7FWH9_9ACTN|nr:hypothetical protein [Actinomadura parmotrematis]MBW8483803.1 hypothetical protein [Actinomadura parmotrematis]